MWLWIHTFNGTQKSPRSHVGQKYSPPQGFSGLSPLSRHSLCLPVKLVTQHSSGSQCRSDKQRSSASATCIRAATNKTNTTTVNFIFVSICCYNRPRRWNKMKGKNRLSHAHFPQCVVNRKLLETTTPVTWLTQSPNYNIVVYIIDK